MQRSLYRKLRSVLMVLTVAVFAALFGLADPAEAKAADKTVVVSNGTITAQEIINQGCNEGDNVTLKNTTTDTTVLILDENLSLGSIVTSNGGSTLNFRDLTSLTIQGDKKLTVNCNSEFDPAIRAANISITGGEVEAKGKMGGISAQSRPGGASGSFSITGANTVVNATGEDGSGLFAVDMSIEGGTVTATTTGEVEDAIYVRNIEIKGGTVTVKGEANNARGIYAFDGDMIVTGGSVKAEGTVGIRVDGGSLSISGSNTLLKAKGSANTYGVMTTGGITVREADGLKIVKPDGGKVGTIDGKYYIVNGEVIATDVEIRKPDPVANDFVITFPSNTVFDGKPKTVTAKPATGVTGMGTITVKYYDSDGNPLTGSPTEIGTYKVKLDVTEGDHYMAAEGITKDDWSFTIGSPVDVTGVSVSPKEITLKPDDTKKLTATVKPDDATNKNVTWKSDDEDIAKVSDDGTVTAVAEGETYVTVTTVDGNKTAKCRVIVRNDAPVTEEYTITFKANGGKGEMEPQTGDKGETIKLRANDFSRSGYEFKNWNTKADGSGDKYDNKQSIELKEDMTLYAQWREKDDDDDDDDHEDEPAPSNNKNVKVPDGFDELRGLLSKAISDAKSSGLEQTVKWDKGTSLPYDVMKMLQDNPKITLEFSYTYKDQSFTVKIPGKSVIANPTVQWYGPIYLYIMYGKNDAASVTSQTSAATGTYTVKSGDTLSGIAKHLHTTLKHLKDTNNIKDADKIKPGMVLRY